jgi:hypothetical protein
MILLEKEGQVGRLRRFSASDTDIYSSKYSLPGLKKLITGLICDSSHKEQSNPES